MASGNNIIKLGSLSVDQNSFQSMNDQFYILVQSVSDSESNIESIPVGMKVASSLVSFELQDAVFNNGVILSLLIDDHYIHPSMKSSVPEFCLARYNTETRVWGCYQKDVNLIYGDDGIRVEGRIKSFSNWGVLYGESNSEYSSSYSSSNNSKENSSILIATVVTIGLVVIISAAVIIVYFKHKSMKKRKEIYKLRTILANSETSSRSMDHSAEES